MPAALSKLSCRSKTKKIYWGITNHLLFGSPRFQILESNILYIKEMCSMWNAFYKKKMYIENSIFSHVFFNNVYTLFSYT